MQEVVETWIVELGTAHTETQRWTATLKRWQAMTPMKPGAARAAAQAQLGEASSIAAICVEGLLSLPDYNGVFFPRTAREQGWPRFESAEGKHLFRNVEHGLWMLRYAVDN